MRIGPLFYEKYESLRALGLLLPRGMCLSLQWDTFLRSWWFCFSRIKSQDEDFPLL